MTQLPTDPITYYKMTLEVTEDGLVLYTKRYVSIRETPRIHFCVSDWDAGRYLYNCPTGTTLLAYAKERKLKLYRIHKTDSRIAFPTQEKAFEHLLWMKRLQRKHLERQQKVVAKFLELVEDKKLEDFPKDGFFGSQDYSRTLPDTLDFVLSLYRFD